MDSVSSPQFLNLFYHINWWIPSFSSCRFRINLSGSVNDYSSSIAFQLLKFCCFLLFFLSLQIYT